MQALKTLESRGRLAGITPFLGLGGGTPADSNGGARPGRLYAIEVAGRLLLTTELPLGRPRIRGDGGSERADEWAKEAAAESLCNSAQKTILCQSSLAFVSRGITESKTRTQRGGPAAASGASADIAPQRQANPKGADE